MDLKVLVSSVKTCYDVETLTKLEAGLTMTSREIAELTGVRHDNAKRTLESLVESGIVVQPQLEDEPFLDSLGRQRSERIYYLDERTATILSARLSAEFTARVVDQWLEMRRLIAYQQQEIEKLRLAEIKSLKSKVSREQNKAQTAKLYSALTTTSLLKKYRSSPELQEEAILTFQAEQNFLLEERKFSFLYDNVVKELYHTQDKLRELDRYCKTYCKVKPEYSHVSYPFLLEVLSYTRPLANAM